MGRKTTAEQQLASEAARALAGMRKTFGAGTGRPRKIKHDGRLKKCPCVECRKERGEYPETQGGVTGLKKTA